MNQSFSNKIRPTYATKLPELIWKHKKEMEKNGYGEYFLATIYKNRSNEL